MFVRPMLKLLNRLLGKTKEPKQFRLEYFPPDPESITPTYCNLHAHIGTEKVGEATCYFEPGKPFTIETIKVCSQHRSRGYGSKMIDFLRMEARKSSCTKFVFHGVDDNNHKAIALYDRLGATKGISRSGKTDYEISPP